MTRRIENTVNIYSADGKRIATGVAWPVARCPATLAANLALIHAGACFLHAGEGEFEIAKPHEPAEAFAWPGVDADEEDRARIRGNIERRRIEARDDRSPRNDD